MAPLMKLLSTLIVAILMISCQSDLKKKESEEAYKKGIETLEKLLVDGQPDYKKAKEYFSRATQLNPNNIKAQYWKAHAEFYLAKFDETYITATNALGKSKFKHSLRPDFLVIAGLSAKKLGKNGDEYFIEATKIYEKRIKRNINDIDAIANKAIILCYMDKKNDAIEFLNTLFLNENNQALLEQIKIDIQTFDTGEFLNQVTIEK
jgi:tetratricopeptide (TPR) repeat protein